MATKLFNRGTSPNVEFKHPDLVKVQDAYELIKDCLDGQSRVKYRKTKYLPMPNSSDSSVANQKRYDEYLARAVFYNVTRRTLSGLTGQVFLREPIVEVPTLLDPIIINANGAGVSLNQTSKGNLANALSFGRSSLYVDYPPTEGAATKAELVAGDVRPTINRYAPWEVINWRTIIRGGRELLSLVVIQEEYIDKDDGFEQVKCKQYRVLTLENNSVYKVDIYRNTTGAFSIYETYYPLDGQGNQLTEIPFTFIGSESNDATPDAPPLYDLAAINIAHYRNSADYEESCYIVGQPTPYFAGLTEQWVKDVFKGQVALGSRAAVPLPVGGTAGLLQAASNTMPFEAMQHKERQMVALGAKLVEQATVQRTATEADIENTSETSILSSSANNVGAAVKWALEWCARFLNQPIDGIKYSLNTEFDLTQMTPEERAELIKEWQSGAIAFEEMRENLRRAGVAKLDDAQAKALIDKELEQSLMNQGANSNNPANNDPNNGNGNAN